MLLVLGDTGTADQEDLCAVYGSALDADLVVTPPGGAISPVLLATARPLELAVPIAQGVPAVPAPPGYPVDRTSTDGDLELRGWTRGPPGEPVSPLAILHSMARDAPLNQLTLIHGDERFLVDRSVQAWRDRARPPQLDVEVFDGPGRLDEFRHAVAEMPLFDPERALLLRDPPQLTGSAKRGGADPPERLVAILAELAPTTVLCLVAHAKVPGSQCRARGGQGTRAERSSSTPRSRVASFERGSSARSPNAASGSDAGSVDHLIRVAGPDLGSIASELDKLVAFAAGRPLSISRASGLAVAGDEASGLYDTLGDLLGPTPAKGAESIDRLLSEGRAGQYLLAILAGQIRDLAARPGLRPAPRIRRRVLRRRSANRTGMADRLAVRREACPAALAAGWLGRSTTPIESSRSARSPTPTGSASRSCGPPPS